MLHTTSIKGFDPIKLTERVEELVARGHKRKYYRFRGSRFYGGSAVGDVVGCNLRCIFCWSGRARDDPTIGFWVDAYEAYRRLEDIANRYSYSIVRLSGGEPTIGWKHLIHLLELFEQHGARRIFVLETNGIRIGYDKAKACQLARYRNVHVRISIKACSPELFEKLTLARREAFELQLRAAKNLADCNVDYHIALFASYGDEKCWSNLVSSLVELVGSDIVEKIEIEYLILYRNVKRRLKLYEKLLGIKPRVAYEP